MTLEEMKKVMFTYEELDEVVRRCGILADDTRLARNMRIHLLDLQNAARRMQIDYDIDLAYYYDGVDTGAQSE